MVKFSALIVDDEPIARLGIRLKLESSPDFEIVGECANGLEAVRAIKVKQPDLVFLDVLMPEMDGVQVVRALGPQNMPEVIFVTAYDEHAIHAFEVNAVDYLLKPVDARRFDLAVDRARRRITARESDFPAKLDRLLGELGNKPKYLDRIAVKKQGKIYFIETEDLDWIEASGNYLTLHVGSKTHLVSGSMASISRRLDPDHFRRIHRSIIVNLGRIKELHPLFHGEYRVILTNGVQLTSGRRYCEAIKEYLRSCL